MPRVKNKEVTKKFAIAMFLSMLTLNAVVTTYVVNRVSHTHDYWLLIIPVLFFFQLMPAIPQIIMVLRRPSSGQRKER